MPSQRDAQHQHGRAAYDLKGLAVVFGEKDFDSSRALRQRFQLFPVRVVAHDLQAEAGKTGRETAECFDEKIGAFQVPGLSEEQGVRVFGGFVRGHDGNRTKFVEEGLPRIAQQRIGIERAFLEKMRAVAGPHAVVETNIGIETAQAVGHGGMRSVVQVGPVRRGCDLDHQFGSREDLEDHAARRRREVRIGHDAVDRLFPMRAQPFGDIEPMDAESARRTPSHRHARNQRYWKLPRLKIGHEPGPKTFSTCSESRYQTGCRTSPSRLPARRKKRSASRSSVGGTRLV